MQTVYVPVKEESIFKVVVKEDSEGNSMSCNVKRVEGTILSKEDSEKIKVVLAKVLSNGLAGVRTLNKCKEALQILNK